MKKILALFLAVCMMCAQMPTVYAADIASEDRGAIEIDLEGEAAGESGESEDEANDDTSKPDNEASETDDDTDEDTDNDTNDDTNEQEKQPDEPGGLEDEAADEPGELEVDLTDLNNPFADTDELVFPQIIDQGISEFVASSGTVDWLYMAGFGSGWYDDWQMWWLGADEDDTLDMKFTLINSFSGLLRIELTKASDFGKFQFYLDGVKIGAPVDCYNSNVILCPSILLGRVALEAGEHVLTAKVLERNPDSTGNLFGFSKFVLNSDIALEDKVIQGQYMEVLSLTAGNTQVQDIVKDFPELNLDYGGGKQLWWNRSSTPNLQVGGELELALDLDSSVTDLELSMSFTHAGDYGKFQAYIDGEAVGDVFDLYHESPPLLINEVVSFGKVTLAAGRHILKFECRGKNESSTVGDGYMLGLDKLILSEPAPEDTTYYTYEDIVNQMLDLEHIALLPTPGEKGAEWSAWDRASRYNETTGTYSNWGANADWTGYIEQVGGTDRYLIADMEGPGVIWRIWSADPKGGIIEFVIDSDDDDPQTAWNDRTFSKNYSSLFTGQDSFFNFPGLSFIVSQGKNTYQPITFNKSCKVYIRNTGNPLNCYYQITYSKLPEGAEVESTTGTLTSEQRAALTRVSDYFLQTGNNPNDLSGAITTINDSVTVPAGGKSTVLDQSGEGAVAQFKVKLGSGIENMNSAELMQMLKELTVSMYWDGETSPSVWAPLCDFFGDSTGAEYFKTLPMGFTVDDEFYCYIYMPFGNGAKIVIGNDGTEARNLEVNAVVVPLKGDPADYGRFHAKWHRGFYDERSDRYPDYNVLRVNGTGRFLGFSLHVYKTTHSTVSDGPEYWWGEGDEKFYVDGETFPSSFGTGSEDYFGYAWCDPGYFQSPHQAQPITAEGGVHGKGHKANVRFQLNDNVPFFESFDGYIEKYYKDNTNYGITSYWYLEEGGVDTYPVLDLDTRTNYYEPKSSNKNMIFEGESMSFSNTVGETLNQDMTFVSAFNSWSNNRQLLWWELTENPVGESITFTFNTKEAASGNLIMKVGKAADFGIHKFYLDGQPIGRETDSYNQKLTHSGGIVLGQVNLDRGAHTFEVEITGKNSASTGYLFGLDALVIDPTPPTDGLIEGEEMEVLRLTAGSANLQAMGVGSGTWESAGTYSKLAQLWWTTARAGNLALDGELDLALDLAEPVNSEMILYCTKANDYGIFQAYIDGVEVGEPFNLYDGNVVRSGPISLGGVELSAGRHVLTFKAVGRTGANFMFGLDCIVFNIPYMNELRELVAEAADLEETDYTADTWESFIQALDNANVLLAGNLTYDDADELQAAYNDLLSAIEGLKTIGGEGYLTYVDIVNRMLDMEYIARLPLQGEKGAEWTSTDRGSVYDAGTDSYIGWDYNSDWTGYIENVGDGRYLIADLEGPGVIWRIWSANPSGTIEICIDGDTYDEPTISKAFNNAFFSGSDDYFSYSGLNYIAAQGRNSYQPITYNESCKIYLSGMGSSLSCYYMVNYTTLPEGVQVESSKASLNATQRAALAKVNSFFLNRLGSIPNSDELSETLEEINSQQFTVPAGGSSTILNFNGEGAIVQFKVRLDANDLSGTPVENLQLLKELTVSMYWDGETSPSVWAPLGDFFGDSTGNHQFTTLPMGYKNGVFYCYVYMPFANGAKIIIGNDGAEDRDITVDASVAPLKGEAGDYGRFHAKWHRGEYNSRADRWPDYSVLKTQGAGRWLGMSLHVYELTDAGWWGEGDEKFFVDGEKFPSSLGTGSEDYFGYAWCDPTVFNTRPYHAQPYNEGGVGGEGHKANVRFQLNDNVPFFESFDGYIEKYYRDTANYAVTAYWYLSPGGTDPYGPVPLEARVEYYENVEASMVIPSRDIISTASTSGTPSYQNMTAYAGAWKNDQQLIWSLPLGSNGGPGNKLDMEFAVKRDCDGLLRISLTKGPDFGIVQFYLDGEPIGAPIDCYNQKVALSPTIALGEAVLSKGTHVLTAEITGKNPSNTVANGYLFGFDCLTLDIDKPVKGIIEGQNMEVLRITNGSAQIQSIGAGTGTFENAGEYGGGKQLWWTNSPSPSLAEGGVLELALDLDEAVDSELVIYCTMASDYGIFKAYLDDEEAAEFDLYNNGVVRSGSISLGHVTLDAGRHVLKLEAVGRTGSNYMFGLDRVVFLSIAEVPGLDELKELVREAKLINRDDYTEASWASLEAALAEAEEMLTQELTFDDALRIKDAINTLSNALKKLEERPVIVEIPGLKELRELVEEARLKTRNGYTEESWIAFEAALAEAEELLAQELTLDDASRINTLLNKLSDAMDGLKEAEGIFWTVTFISNSSVYQTQKVTDGGNALKPADPVRSGYSFDGWYVNDGFTLEWYFSNSVTEDITLYAKWTASISGGSSGKGGGGSRIINGSAIAGRGNADTNVTIPEEEAPLGLGGLGLERTEHIQYITGYPDGTFRPDNTITRGEAAAIFYKLLAGVEKTGYSPVFSDVPANTWYADAVNCLAANGIISGYPDGKFYPDNPITRAEFVALASQFDELAVTDKNIFPDVPDDHWALKYINSFAAKGWITGYEDGTFRPEGNITRAEAVTLINAMLDRRIEAKDIPGGVTGFTDVDATHWAYANIVEASGKYEY